MKKLYFHISPIIEKYLNKVFAKLPDRFTGEKAIFEKEFYRLYGVRNLDDKIESIKKENLKRYVWILACTVLFIILMGVSTLVNDSNELSVDEKGQLYIQRPLQGNLTIPLTVTGKIEGEQWNRNVVVTLRAEGSNEAEKREKKAEITVEEGVNADLNQLVRAINKSDDGKMIYLPNMLDGIQELKWKKKESNEFGLVMTILLGTFVFAYLRRYDSAKKLNIKCQDSISRELPEFLNKIVLLMNAGLVLTAAFERIIRDYGERKFGNESYFYDQLEEIHTKMVHVNSPLIIELRLFAERSRHRELMRLISIMADNLDKGTELVSKLQAESSFLWFERKKKAEEKGKLAETKLTIPLAIQLLVLIIITVAPALMQM